MSSFLKEVVTGKNFELLIDTKIFPKDIILKASYNFLDKGYFFFKYSPEGSITLEFTLKDDCKENPRIIIGEFSDELLNVYLRDRLEKDNRVIRETIVSKSLLGPLETQNYVSHDPNNPVVVGDEKITEEIDFDKDIDEIIKEIENDPDLQIDEDEIQQMLREIEEETAAEQIEKPTITIDKAGIDGAKEMFKKK